MTNSEPTMILAMILANYEGTLPGCENDGPMLAACLPDSRFGGAPGRPGRRAPSPYQ